MTELESLKRQIDTIKREIVRRESEMGYVLAEVLTVDCEPNELAEIEAERQALLERGNMSIDEMRDVLTTLESLTLPH